MDAEIRAQLDAWLADYAADKVAVADLLCDRHAPSGRVALVYEDATGRSERYTFEELRDRSSRLAGALRDGGIGRGERVATLLPKSPELLIALLAIWRLGAAHVPLFTAFGPDAVSYRLQHSGARALLTDGGNRGKVPRQAAAQLDRILTVTADGSSPPEGDVSFWQAIDTAQPLLAPEVTTGDDLFILLYTSGTTGNPKGVEVPVRALASFHAYLHYALDVRDDDVYWNVADPGWAYGLWYGVAGPLLAGRTTMLRNVPFDADRTYDALLRHGVTNLAAAPTVYRGLRAAGVPEGFRERSRLRAISSAGEPLNPEMLAWSERQLGTVIHDHYGQSELGMVVTNPHHPALRRPLRPGSMGHGFPGYRMVVVTPEGREAAPDEDGELAVDTEHSPLYWFRGYYRDPERTAGRFPYGDRYYLTGDAARMDADGYFYFASRADDVISSAGYRIGPFEVESALMAHPAVGEAAVIGTPDELRGEAVTAYIVLADGHAGGDDLAEELQHLVKSRLSAHAYPRRITFTDTLPKTPSGKIQRNVLRDRWRKAHATVAD